MMNDAAERRPNRLANYDYSLPGAYFITICTAERKCVFWKEQYLMPMGVGEAISLPGYPHTLNEFGKVAYQAINAIPEHYQNVSVDKFVVMPNHIHLILSINGNGGRIISAPTVSQIIGQTKRYISKTTGRSIWQRSFHDHVIRGEDDYLSIWQYIDTNPLKWEDDCFYTQNRKEANL